MQGLNVERVTLHDEITNKHKCIAMKFTSTLSFFSNKKKSQYYTVYLTAEIEDNTKNLKKSKSLNSQNITLNKIVIDEHGPMLSLHAAWESKVLDVIDLDESEDISWADLKAEHVLIKSLPFSNNAEKHADSDYNDASFYGKSEDNDDHI